MKLQSLSRPLLLASLCGLFSLSAPASPPVAPAAPAADRPEPVIADIALNCAPLMTAAGDLNLTAAPRTDSGWLLVQYSLDGSGRAQQVKVLDSHRAKDLQKQVLKMVRSASYRQGEVRARCQEVIGFHRTPA